MEELYTKVKKTLAFHGHRAAVGARMLRSELLECRLDRPIFVVGCSRGGTTLVYKTLSESEQLGSLQKETHDFWAALQPLHQRCWDSHAIPATAANNNDRNRVARHFYAQTGTMRVVDKNNQNGLSIPYLQALFADAIFVFIKRSPGDNINSLIEGWKKAKEFGTWSDGLPEKLEIDNGEFRKWCFFLAEGWRDYTKASIEEVCAFQYRAINQTILDAKQLVPAAQWVEIKYEDILVDPVNVFREVFSQCDLKFTGKIVQHCEQVLSKPYNAFSEIRVNKWKQGSHKSRIERVLPRMKLISERLGYDLANTRE